MTQTSTSTSETPCCSRGMQKAVSWLCGERSSFALDHADSQYNLGNGLRSSGQLTDAVAAYQAALRLHPRHVDAHGNLGVVLHELGCPDEARPHFEQASVLQLNHEPALRGLATLEQVAGRHEQAAMFFGRVVEIAPDDLNMHVQLVRSLERSGQRAAAFNATIVVLQHFPTDRTLVMMLVESLQESTEQIDGVAATVVRATLLEAATDDTFPPEKLLNPIVRLIVAAPGMLA